MSSSKSKITNVICRVESCKVSVKEQNYFRHLKNKHPNEDPNDLWPYGQKKLSLIGLIEQGTQSKHYNTVNNNLEVEDGNPSSVASDDLVTVTTFGQGDFWDHELELNELDYDLERSRSPLVKERECEISDESPNKIKERIENGKIIDVSVFRRTVEAGLLGNYWTF